MGVYLRLFHGRKDPRQEMDDWGEQGPIFGPYDYAHTTYASDIKLGPSEQDNHELRIKGALAYYNGMYYGDWSVSTMGADTVDTFDPEKAIWPDEGELAEIEKLAKRLGINEGSVESNEAIHDIDDLVHDLKSGEASNINNGGLSSQLSYILEALGPEEAANAIRKIAGQ